MGLQLLYRGKFDPKREVHTLKGTMTLTDYKSLFIYKHLYLQALIQVPSVTIQWNPGSFHWILVPFHWNPADSCGIQRNGCIPAGICGASKSTGSKIAKDGQEWKGYYVNRSVNSTWFLDMASSNHSGRFANCNMMMRYHWGIGIGHMYARGHISAAQIAPESILNSAPAAPYQDRGEKLNEMGGYKSYDSSHNDADSDD